MEHIFQAIEAYLANKADHGDELAKALHAELLRAMSAPTEPIGPCFDGFHDADFVKSCRKEYEAIRQRRKAIREKPDVYERLILEMDKAAEPFYRRVSAQQNTDENTAGKRLIFNLKEKP